MNLVEDMTMKYAVELYYDKKTEKRLLDMVHLACFNDVDEERCIKNLKTLRKVIK